jgi:hypothetical protein
MAFLISKSYLKIDSFSSACALQMTLKYFLLYCTQQEHQGKGRNEEER